MILLIIICFKTLLEDFSKNEYSNFIKRHKKNYEIFIIGNLRNF